MNAIMTRAFYVELEGGTFFEIDIVAKLNRLIFASKDFCLFHVDPRETTLALCFSSWPSFYP